MNPSDEDVEAMFSNDTSPMKNMKDESNIPEMGSYDNYAALCSTAFNSPLAVVN